MLSTLFHIRLNMLFKGILNLPILSYTLMKMCKKCKINYSLSYFGKEYFIKILYLVVVLDQTLKYQTTILQKPNPEPTEPPVSSSKSNYLILNRTSNITKQDDKKWVIFQGGFPAKLNLELTELLVCPQKPNLEPTKTKPNLELNQV